jgi:[ribosomal protein S18]-alanine N-acetyltransferase
MSSIRAATDADLPGILDIEQRSFEHASERFAERKIRGLLRNRRAIALVAEGGGAVAAWACGFVFRSGGAVWGRVYAIAVHPDQRGRKLGPSLLQHLLGELRQRGAKDIFLEVRTDNHAALKLDQKHGFRFVRRLENFYAPGISAVRMCTSPEV